MVNNGTRSLLYLHSSINKFKGKTSFCIFQEMRRLPSPSIAFPGTGARKSWDGGRLPFSPSLAGSFAARSRWIRGCPRSPGRRRDAWLDEASSDNCDARNEPIIKTPISAGKPAPPRLSPPFRFTPGMLVRFQGCWCSFWGCRYSFSDAGAI